MLKRSLFLRIEHKSGGFTHGSGFIINWKNKNYLVTNFHVLAGREPSDTTIDKNPALGEPTKATIYFFRKDQPDSCVQRTYPLYINGRKKFPILPLHPVVQNIKGVHNANIQIYSELGINYKCPLDLAGSSGAPVYYYTDSSAIFIEMHSGKVDPENRINQAISKTMIYLFALGLY